MGEELAPLLNSIDTAAVIVVLIWVVSRLQSGALISRSMHDEILEVYREEAQKFTNGLESALVEIVETQQEMKQENQEARKEAADSRAKMSQVTVRLMESLDHLNENIEKLQ